MNCTQIYTQRAKNLVNQSGTEEFHVAHPFLDKVFWIYDDSKLDI